LPGRSGHVGLLVSLALVLLAATAGLLLFVERSVEPAKPRDGGDSRGPGSGGRGVSGSEERGARVALDRVSESAPGGGGEEEGAAETGLLLSIAGRVVEAGSLAPVSGLALTFWSSARFSGSGTTRTGEDGSFRCPERVPPSVVTIETDDGVPFLNPEASSLTLQLARVDVSSGDVEGLVVEFPLTGRILGRVVDSAGNAIEGAVVTALALDAQREFILRGGIDIERLTSAVTDTDGGFRFDRMPPDRLLVLIARAEGFVAVKTDPVYAAAASPRTLVDIRLPRPGRVIGRVLGPEGKPLANASADLGSWSLWRPYAAYCNEAGEFEFAVVEPGPHVLAVAAYPYACPHQPFTLSEGETVELEVRGRALFISGVVQDELGQPVVDPNAPFTLQVESADGDWRRSFSPRFGVFRVAVREAGRYRLFLDGAYFDRTDPVEVEAGTDDVRLTWVQSKSSLLARVLEDVTGLPRRGARVYVSRAPRVALALDLETDGAGETREISVASGTYQLVAWAPGCAPARETLEIAPDDRGPRLVEFRLAPGRRVAGRLVREDGEALAGVPVVVRLDGVLLGTRQPTRSDREGRFVLDCLPPDGGEIAVRRESGEVCAAASVGASGEVVIVVPSPAAR
jgi:hypothetical protein